MKKKILMLAVAACLIVLSIASSSLAYFTSIDAKTNVFTAGNVKIALDYSKDDTKTGNRYPGMQYNDTATINNIGSEKAYVGAIITFTNTNAQTDWSEIEPLLNLFTYGTGATATYNSSTRTIFIVFANPVEANTSVTVFSQMTLPTDWDNAEMAAFNGLNVSVTAYATQTVFADSNINTAAKALQTAFGGTDGTGAWGTAFTSAGTSSGN